MCIRDSLRMVADFDMPLFLIFQSLAVSGVGQEQAHFLKIGGRRIVSQLNYLLFRLNVPLVPV